MAEETTEMSKVTQSDETTDAIKGQQEGRADGHGAEEKTEEPHLGDDHETAAKGPIRQEPSGEKLEDESEDADDEVIEGNEGEEDEGHLPVLGGKFHKKAFCLLDGMFEKEGERQRISIALTRLPAVLGRSHATGDRNFFTLGPSKALSRQHAIISYRDELGGKLVTPKNAAKDSDDEDNLEYEKGEPYTVVNPDIMRSVKQEETNGKAPSAVKFPARGSFVLEALGKNLIVVGKQRIKPGEVALLTPGIPIRMSSYSFYFLLPNDIDQPKTMDIPQKEEEKRPTPKKSGTKRKMPSSSKDHPKPKLRRAKAPPFAQLQAELDSLPIQTLLERMDEACKAPRWERKHQLIGSTIACHAVQDASKDTEIRKMAADGGVARTEIMKWICAAPKYSKWVEQMNSKMEPKSYQNTITKALLKGGNERTGTGGRYIKWVLAGVPLNESRGEKEQSAGMAVKKEVGEKNESNNDGNEEEEEEEEENEEYHGDDNDDMQDEEDEQGDKDGNEEQDGGDDTADAEKERQEEN